MDIAAIKKIAVEKKVSFPSDNKADLIHQIQNVEGYSPCFATNKTECDQVGCAWREDCMPKKGNGAKSGSKKK